MVTFVLLYIIMYLTCIVSLFTLSFIYIPLFVLTNYSLTTYLIILQKYNIFKNIFFFFIFALTGLPPVGLFFIKFNILAVILYNTHVVCFLVLFVLFFLNMLYYIQLFNIKNYKKKIYNIFSPEFFNTWRQDTYSSYKTLTYKHYNLMYWLIVMCGGILLTIFILIDMFFIFNL